MRYYTTITAVNDDFVLKDNLLASSIIVDSNTQLIQQKKYQSASLAYNDAIINAKSDIMIFVHQDVYIPAGWQKHLENALTWLKDKPWAVLGVIGTTNVNEDVVGLAWSTGLKREVGCRIETPVRVESIDELLIVVNKKSGVKFDNKLSGFHLYGTDIIQTANKMGYESYVIDAPVIHNSLPLIKFDAGFIDAYRYLQKKWSYRLPIKTPCTTITRYGWPLYKSRLKQCFNGSNRTSYKRLEDPALKAKEIGYE